MKTQGYLIRKRKGLNHWEKLLEEWLLINQRYSRISKNEAIYEFTERACVGALAAAAWRSGSIALEEFQAEKACDRNDVRNGRADLWIADENHEEWIEAKYKWAALSSPQGIKKVASTLQKSALLDARDTSYGNPEELHVGVAFVPVHLPRSKKEESSQLIQEAITEALSIQTDITAWTFPPEMLSDDSGSKRTYYPGMFMFASNLKFADL